MLTFTILSNLSIYKKPEQVVPWQLQLDVIESASVGIYPTSSTFSQAIGSLAVTSSVAGAYSLVYITGAIFIPPSSCYGNTYFNFWGLKNKYTMITHLLS